MAAIVDPDGPKFSNISENPAPDGLRGGYFKTSDNIQLRYAVFPRTDGPNRGTICLVHGRTEFIEKYYETIADFQKRGFMVATFDWRGQGGSDRLISNPRLGFVQRFEDYWTDLHSFHTSILLPDCAPPYYLVGHSMGGMASLMAASRDRMMFDRVFLSSPMVLINGMPLSPPAMATALETACFLGLGSLPLPGSFKSPSHETFPGNSLTSDFERYMRTVHVYSDMPDLEIGAPSVRWAASAARVNARAAAPDFPDRINVPVLMLAAARDEVVSTPAIEQLGLRLRTGRHAVIAHARHEMFIESDAIRGQVLAAFDAFVTEQSG